MNNIFIYWIIFLSSYISSFTYSEIFEHIYDFPFNIAKSCKPCKPCRGPPGPRGPQGIPGATESSSLSHLYLESRGPQTISAETDYMEFSSTPFESSIDPYQPVLRGG